MAANSSSSFLLCAANASRGDREGGMSPSNSRTRGDGRPSLEEPAALLDRGCASVKLGCPAMACRASRCELSGRSASADRDGAFVSQGVLRCFLSLYRLWIWPRIWGAQWREHDCDALIRVHVESTLAARLPAVQSLRWQGLIDMAGQEQQLTWPCRQSEVVRQLFQHGCVQKVAAVANQGSQGGCGDEAAPASGVQVNCGRCTPYHTLPRAAIPASGVG